MTNPAPDLDRTISAIVRTDRGRLLSALIADLGDFALAEDAFSDALESALIHWARTGLPENPQGWLLKVARRKAIDRIRRSVRWRGLRPELERLAQEDEMQNSGSEADIPDERLRLIFTCCHPALDPDAQVALTLRTLGGLSTPEVARAFLVKPATMGARLTRAKDKITKAGIPFNLPVAEDRPARIAAVLRVIYLIYNEGYAATSGDQQLRIDLCEEATFLARLTVKLAPEPEEPRGLLVLILFSHSRRAARTAKDGAYIPLEDQDRRLWDHQMIAEATALLDHTLKAGRVGPYQIQAAIHGLHCQAESFEATDWPQISALYDLLYEMNPSDTVALNRLVARSYVEGPQSVLSELRALQAKLEDYQPYHAALGDVLRRMKARAEAQSAYDRAIALSQVEAERAYLQSRRDAL